MIDDMTASAVTSSTLSVSQTLWMMSNAVCILAFDVIISAIEVFICVSDVRSVPTLVPDSGTFSLLRELYGVSLPVQIIFLLSFKKPFVVQNQIQANVDDADHIDPCRNIGKTERIHVECE